MSFVGVTLVLQPAVEAKQWLGGVAGLCSGVLSALAYMQVRKLGAAGRAGIPRRVLFFADDDLAAGLVGSAARRRGPAVGTFHRPTWHGVGLLLAHRRQRPVAQMAMTRAYRVGKVLVVANLQYTGIIFSSLWGMLLWGDRFDWHVWLGMGVILASGIAATFYNTRSTARGAVVEKTDPIASEL